MINLKDKIYTLAINKSEYAKQLFIFKPNQKKDLQITYSHSSQLFSVIHYTHNHKILNFIKWMKIDQLRRNNLQAILDQSQISHHYIKFQHSYHIKQLCKEYVYDIEVTESCNIIINTEIIHNSIEQDADLILMLYKNDENKPKEILDVIIAKHRNGPTGHFQLLFYPQYCLFENIH